MNNLFKQRGVTLIEAIIAVAVMASGTAAVFGIHSYVSGTSAESRIETAAQGLAQEKLEELRNTHFQMIDSSGSDTRTISLPLLGGSRDLVLKRCWEVIDTEDETGIPAERLKQLQVNVVNDSAECNSEPIASLSSFLASQDPRAAARNVDEQIRADGNAIKEKYDPEALGHNPNAGFIFEDGKIYNPQSGELLRSKDGLPLRYSTLSGNLFFYDTDDLPVTIQNILTEVKVGAQGAATCRIFFPEFELSGIPRNFLAADGKKIEYLQYSCIAADQWRRSIFVIPAAEQEVCVGYSQSPEPMLSADVNKQPGRSYLGFMEGNYPVGIRGSSQTGESMIGSLCEAGMPCWSDINLRGLVPGGHHFFIKEKDEARCDVTLANAFIPAVSEPPTAYPYSGLILRNPGPVFCVSDPKFTNTLSQPDLAESEEEITPTPYCYSFTRISGFITSQSNPATELTISTLPSRNCPMFNLPGSEIVGGYLCDFVDLEINTPREVSANVTPSSAQIEFSNGGTLIDEVLVPNKTRFLPYGGSSETFTNPALHLHDLTNYNLLITPKND